MKTEKGDIIDTAQNIRKTKRKLIKQKKDIFREMIDIDILVSGEQTITEETAARDYLKNFLVLFRIVWAEK